MDIKYFKKLNLLTSEDLNELKKELLRVVDESEYIANVDVNQR